MSVQTILHKSVSSLKDEAIKGTIESAKKFLLKKRFKLGKGYCEEEQFHNSMIIEMDKFNSCPLISYINGVIENGPDNCFKPEIPEEQDCVNQSPIICPTDNIDESLIPDLTIDLTIDSATVSGQSKPVFLVEVSELTNNNTNPDFDIRVIIKKDFTEKFTFDGIYNNALTSVVVGGNTIAVNNADWEYDLSYALSGSHYVFKYIGADNILLGNTSSFFTFDATFNSKGFLGEEVYTASLTVNSGGESNSDNNSDSETVTYIGNVS